MKSLFCSLLIVISLKALGQDNQTVDKVTSGSAENRQGKSYSLVIQPWGIGPTMDANAGVGFNYFLTADSSILVEWTDSDFWEDKDSDEISNKSFGVHYKKFVSNTFYYRAGVDQRSTFIKKSLNRGMGPARDEGFWTFKGNSTAITVLIGNQWQWDNFTLGVDWIGASLPLASKTEEEEKSGKDYFDDDKKDFVTGYTLDLLKLYLGISW